MSGLLLGSPPIHPVTHPVVIPGNIPSYSYIEGKAYRHGDIEDVIANLFKAAGGGFLSKGTKFTPLDVKRVYFGNWLRDYSQAVDVGSLKKVPLQTIINIC